MKWVLGKPLAGKKAMTYRVVRQAISRLHWQEELVYGQKKRSFGQKERGETMPLAVAAGFFKPGPGLGQSSVVLQSRTKGGKNLRLKKARKEVKMRSIIHAYADSVWQEVTEFVNAFVILYKAEVI